MGEAWWRISPANDKAARALLYRLGPERFRRSRAARLGAFAGDGAHDPAWRALATLPERWTAPVFPLKAADFIKRGVPQGPALGAALRAAEEAWIAADFPADQRGHCRHCRRGDRRSPPDVAGGPVMIFGFQIAVLDLGPILEADDRLVFLEADALADEADVALRELAEHVLHGAHRVHQQRDAVDRDLEAHLGELRRRQDRRAAALQHVRHLRHVELPADHAPARPRRAATR